MSGQDAKCRKSEGGRCNGGWRSIRAAILSGLIGVLVCSSLSLGAVVSTQRILASRFPQVQFSDVALENVIDYLRQSTGANFFVDWKALEQAGVTRQTPVTLKLHNMPFATTLNFILRSAGGSTPLSWYVDQNVIQITARQAADRQMVRRVYPVADLLMVIPDFSDAPSFDLSQIGNSSSGQGGGSASNSSLFANTSQQRQNTGTTPRQRAEELIALITENIRPDIWRRNGGEASIVYFNGALIVTAPRDVQEAIGGQWGL